MQQALLTLGQFVIGLIPDNLWALLGVGAAFFGFWVVGARLLRGYPASESALAGWALFYLTCVVAALGGLADLRWIAGLLLALAVSSLYAQWRNVLPSREGLIAALLLLPVAVIALGMPLLHWDSYSHWALNASYLFRFNHFPLIPLDGFPSPQPAYPAATSLVYYLASLITGHFREGAGMFMNVVLTLIALNCVICLLRDVLSRQSHNGEPAALDRYALVVVALGLVLTLNPSFRLVNYFSAIADPALGVVVMVTIIRWCSFFWADGAGYDIRDSSLKSLLFTRDTVRNLLVLFFFGVLIGGMRPAAWVLAFVLAVSGMCLGIALRIAWMRWVAPAIAMFSGATIAQSLWSMYVSTHLVRRDMFSIKPVSQWRFDLVPGLLKGIQADLLVEPFYYSLVSLSVVVGLIALLRRSSMKREPLLQMLAFVSMALPAYVLSILAAYLGTGIFNENEILRAASMHRYSSHIGYAACAFGLIALVSALLRLSVISRLKLPRWQAVVLGLGLYAIPLGWNILMPAMYAGHYYLQSYQPLRNSAAMMSNVIPPQDNVAIIGPDWAVNLGSYHLWRPAEDTRGPSLALGGGELAPTIADVPSGLEFIRRSMADRSVDHIWAFDAEVINTALGRPHARNYLWSRSTGQWRVIDEAAANLTSGGRQREQTAR